MLNRRPEEVLLANYYGKFLFGEALSGLRVRFIAGFAVRMYD